jgi:hypothetical protein
MFLHAPISQPNLGYKKPGLMLNQLFYASGISMFSGLIVVLSYSEGGLIGVSIAVTIALFGGILNRYFGIHTGVQFMAYYASGWMISKLFGV